MRDPKFRRAYRKRIYYNVNLDEPDEELAPKRLDFSRGNQNSNIWSRNSPRDEVGLFTFSSNIRKFILDYIFLLEKIWTNICIVAERLNYHTR